MPAIFPIQRGLTRAAVFALIGLVSAQDFVNADAIALPQAGGQELVLESTARSLVALSPHLTELVFAAGAGEKLAATVAYSDHPPDARDLPRIGDAFRIDTEQIHLISPDLVLAWQTGNPPEAIDHLAGLGIAVWVVEIRYPEGIPRTIELIGRATGTTEPAERAARALRATISGLGERYAGLQPVRYFYQISARPLYTVNGEHLISRALELCAGENVFSGLPGLAPQIGLEAVLLADPLLLMAPEIEGQPDPLSQWEEWPRLQAVRQGNRLLLPADAISRATPRFFDAVELACAIMDDLRGQQKSQDE